MGKQNYALFLIIAGIAFGAGFLFVMYNPLETVPVPTATPKLVGGDTDEYGCKGSAGYSWCAPKGKCLRVWEEACYATPEQEISYFLADKYGKDVSDVSVRINKRGGDYMAGSVKFIDTSVPGSNEGGMFLATKQNSISWTVVYDGNGSVDCRALKTDYNFPPDILRGFCD